MVALSNQPASTDVKTRALPEPDRAYRLFWRLRSNSSWRREEFDSRAEAFDRFFNLMQKGLELRWGSV